MHLSKSRASLGSEASDWKTQLRKHSKTIEKVVAVHGSSQRGAVREGQLTMNGVKQRILVQDAKLLCAPGGKERLASEESEKSKSRLSFPTAATGNCIKVSRKQSLGLGAKEGYLRPTESAALKQSYCRNLRIARHSLTDEGSRDASLHREQKTASSLLASRRSRPTTASELDCDKENDPRLANAAPATQADCSQSQPQLKDCKPLEGLRQRSAVGESRQDCREQRRFVAFGAESDQGLVRLHNEDRVSVIQKVRRRDEAEDKDCAMFGLFDGHGGGGCADFLKEELLGMVARSGGFASDMKRALLEGFLQAETRFISQARLSRDVSGACAIVAVLQSDRVTVANLGDSRALLAHTDGSCEQMSRDHKPESLGERERILRAGGRVYRLRTCSQVEFLDVNGSSQLGQRDTSFGPFRVEPGGLSVARSIGDVRAKDARLGGNPQCLSSEPEVTEFPLRHSAAFLLLACDGVFDVLSNESVCATARESLRFSATNELDEKTACSKASLAVIEEAKRRKSRDNLTVVLVLFKPLVCCLSLS